MSLHIKGDHSRGFLTASHSCYAVEIDFSMNDGNTHGPALG